MSINNKENEENKVINFPAYIPGKDDEHRMVFTDRMKGLIKRAREIVKDYKEHREEIFDNEYFFSKKYSIILNESAGLIESTLEMIDSGKINSADEEDRDLLEGSLYLYIKQWNVNLLEGSEGYNQRRIKELGEREKELLKKPIDDKISRFISKDEQ